jgi:hypothetical protein
MVQIIPNSAIIKGSVSEIIPYDKQAGYSILVLKVNAAEEKKEEAFLFNKAEDSKIKVLISNQQIGELKLKVKDTIEGELKKVNIDLWKAVDITSK